MLIKCFQIGHKDNLTGMQNTCQCILSEYIPHQRITILVNRQCPWMTSLKNVVLQAKWYTLLPLREPFQNEQLRETLWLAH